jgi:hypothetical protein
MQEGRLAIGSDGRDAGGFGGSPLKAATEICLNSCPIFSGFEVTPEQAAQNIQLRSCLFLLLLFLSITSSIAWRRIINQWLRSRRHENPSLWQWQPMNRRVSTVSSSYHGDRALTRESTSKTN